MGQAIVVHAQDFEPAASVWWARPVSTTFSREAAGGPTALAATDASQSLREPD